MQDIYIENINTIVKLQSWYNNLLDYAPGYFAKINQYISSRLSEIQSILYSLKRNVTSAKSQLEYANDALYEARQPRYETHYYVDDDGYEYEETETYYIDTTPYEDAVYEAKARLIEARANLLKMEHIYEKVMSYKNSYMSIFDNTKRMSINFSQENIEFLQMVQLIFHEYIEAGKEDISTFTGNNQDSSGNNGYSTIEKIFLNCIQTAKKYFNQNLVDKWGSMGKNARKEYLHTFTAEFSQQLLLGSMGIQFDDMDQNSRGYFKNGENVVHVNSDVLLNSDNLKDGVDTIMHELRHAFQHQAVNDPEKYGIPKAIAELWQDNFDNYISPAWDLEGYYNQPVEVDARDFAETIVSGLI